MEIMEYHPEFPLCAPRLTQTVKQFYDYEHLFMASEVEDYLQSPRKIQLRKHALGTIVKYTQGQGYKAYIPYIALNHFDRFFSNYTLPDAQEKDEENVRLIAICCLAMAIKLCINNFCLQSFLKRHDIEIPEEKLEAVEFKILQALRWKSRPLTPFCFLNSFYPRFKNLGGFSRRCIHQIIVNSLAEESFTKYKPSLIALSSFLAAARILYGSERLHVTDNEVTPCFPEMISLCIRKNIEIEPACVDGEIREESVVYPWTKKARDAILGIQEKVEGQDRDWDFDVQWLLPSDAQQVVEPTRTRVRSKL